MRTISSTWLIGVLVCATTLAGCASHPNKIEAKHIAPATYKNFTCQELVDEIKVIEPKMVKTCLDQEFNAGYDAGTVTASIIILPLGLAMLAATSDYEDELAELKGQSQAIRSAADNINCEMPPPPEKETGFWRDSDCPLFPNTDVWSEFTDSKYISSQ